MYSSKILCKLRKPSTEAGKGPSASVCCGHFPIYLLVWLVYSYELRLLTN